MNKIIKENCVFFSYFIRQSFNHMIGVLIFPAALKSANIVSVFKKGPQNSKENYTPVSILSNLSKIYKRYVFSPMSSYFEEVFLKFQCGFNQSLSAQ